LAAGFFLSFSWGAFCIIGSDKSLISAATSDAGAKAGDGINAAIESVKGSLEKPDKP